MESYRWVCKLHFVWTKDTQKLTEDIIKRVAELIGVRDEKIWIEIIPYSRFANNETQVWLDKSVCWKHVYVITDVNSHRINHEEALKIILNSHKDEITEYATRLYNTDKVSISVESENIVVTINNKNWKECEKILPVKLDTSKFSFESDSIEDKIICLELTESWKIIDTPVLSWKVWISLNDREKQSELICKAVWDNLARSVNVVQPTYPYSRQDKPPAKWIRKKWEWEKIEPAAAALVPDYLKVLWVENFITMDVHNDATQLAFKGVKFINRWTSWLVKTVLERLDLENIKLSPADQWGYAKMEKICKAIHEETPDIAKEVDWKILSVIKTRDYSKKNKVTEIDIYWDIKWKNVLIHDDILDTWGTLCTLIDELLKLWPASITVVETHWLLNGTAIEKLTKYHKEWKLNKIFVTNSTYRENLPDFIEVIDTSDEFATTIASIYKWEEIDLTSWLH